MSRSSRLIPLAAALVLAAGTGTASADPVEDALRKVDSVVGGPGGGHPGGTRARSAVVGYVSIEHVTALGQDRPGFTLTGALADPSLWHCADNHPAVPYAVTCTPLPGVVVTGWTCDVLHADVVGASDSARGRTTLDCDGGEPEAATEVVTGIDSRTAWAASGVVVSRFTCTLDGGGGDAAAAPDLHGGCGDPGAPEVG